MEIQTGDIVRINCMPNHFINKGITAVTETLCPELTDACREHRPTPTRWVAREAVVEADGEANVPSWGTVHCFVLRLLDSDCAYMATSERIVKCMETTFTLLRREEAIPEPEFLSLLEAGA